ncbi:MAG: phosphatidylglycerol lysyltransferase domain-containing protein [Oscillospiraceae bacterium]|nr:phosphatidylglycerol lysyltransferase domain-containing protein [Oscillospiraceae bacterium]
MRPFFGFVSSRICDFTVGGMFMWRDFYKMKFAVEDSTFFSKMTFPDGGEFFLLPLSPDTERSVKRLIENENGHVNFAVIPEEYVPMLLKICPDANVKEQTDFADYLYNAGDLITLEGRKYSGQRNLINQFRRSAPNYTVTDADDVSPDEFAAFLQNVYREDKNANSEEKNENREVLEVIQNRALYGMIGCALFSDGRMLGFSLGEKRGDTLYTHIEKADRSVNGAYQTLVNEFSSRYGADVKYINREEDMGDAGLRRAKLAYHPTAMLKKYTIEVH